jgi:hypothetical protein
VILVAGIIAFVLLLLFLPFFVSLFGAKISAFLTFLASSASVLAFVGWILSGIAGAGTDPSYEIAFCIFWMSAWGFAVVGIWQKRRKKNQILGPVRNLYLTTFRDRLKSEEGAYIDRRGRHISN